MHHVHTHACSWVWLTHTAVCANERGIINIFHVLTAFSFLFTILIIGSDSVVDCISFILKCHCRFLTGCNRMERLVLPHIAAI